MTTQSKIRRNIRKAELRLSRVSRTNHILHLLLTILTAGLWIIPWILIAMSNASEAAKYTNKIVDLEDQLEQYNT